MNHVVQVFFRERREDCFEALLVASTHEFNPMGSQELWIKGFKALPNQFLGVVPFGKRRPDGGQHGYQRLQTIDIAFLYSRHYLQEQTSRTGDISFPVKLYTQVECGGVLLRSQIVICQVLGNVAVQEFHLTCKRLFRLPVNLGYGEDSGAEKKEQD